ncbi:hypothetical protein LCGC14_2030840, partial [marine sediment metagenome]
MTRKTLIIAAIFLLASCAPALQSVHDGVYSKFTYVRGMPVAQWDNGRFKGNCLAFALEVLSRATERGMDAEYVEGWANEGDVVSGYEIIRHAAVVSDGFVSDNQYRWVYP